MTNLNQLKKDILKNADHCVKCGLCSAQCPTYLINGSENESPRGRISLAQAIASSEISDDTSLKTHIDNCLTCQRCEKICPSGVEFGKIMSHTRHLLTTQNTSPLQDALTHWASQRTHKNWNKIAVFTKFIHITRALKFIPKLSPIEKHLNSNPLKNNHPRIKEETQDVFLFTGCTSHLFDSSTINDAHQLLTRCGFNVLIPDEQVCCGTLPSHKGFLDSAALCQSKNIAAFSNKKTATQTPIIFIATTCGAALINYDNDDFRSRSININTFLINHLKTFEFSTQQTRILVHSPCSEKNALKEQGEVEKLLNKLPNAEIFSLKETTGCCGAAGDYMITHARIANKIRTPLLVDILAAKPDVIVTSNYTCGMHIKNGLQEINIDIPVMHPIQLLLSRIM